MNENSNKSTSLKDDKRKNNWPPHIQRRLDETKKKSNEFWKQQEERLKQQKMSSP